MILKRMEMVTQSATEETAVDGKAKIYALFNDPDSSSAVRTPQANRPAVGGSDV